MTEQACGIFTRRSQQWPNKVPMYNVFVQTLAAFLNRCLDQCCIRVAVLESQKKHENF